MKVLVIIIVKYLRGQLASNTLSPSAAEGVEVAVQCLEDAYEIVPADLQSCVISLDDLLRATIRVPGDGQLITEEQKQQAEALKLVGNRQVRDGLYQEAIYTYTRAIELDPHNAVYYCNRAAAHIQRSNYITGVKDCEEALKLDPSYSKAYSRLGFAHQAMGNRGKALDNYRKAVQLEPENESYKMSLRKLEEMPGGTGSAPHAPVDIMNMLPGVDLSSILKNPVFGQMATQMLEDPSLQTVVSRILAGQSSFPRSSVQEMISAGQQLAEHFRRMSGEVADEEELPGGSDGHYGGSNREESLPMNDPIVNAENAPASADNAPQNVTPGSSGDDPRVVASSLVGELSRVVNPDLVGGGGGDHNPENVRDADRAARNLSGASDAPQPR